MKIIAYIRWKYSLAREWLRGPCKFNRHHMMLERIDDRRGYYVQHAQCQRCRKVQVTVFDRWHRFAPVRSRWVND